MKRVGLVCAALLAGCNLIDSSGLHYDYSFDPQEFKQSIGDEQVMGTVPDITCTPGGVPDLCAQVPASNGVSAVCDATKLKCVAQAEISLPQTIDLRTAKTPLPDQVIQFGISNVTIHRVAYWVAMNSLNVATPAVELFVAPEAAKDEKDPKATKLGSVAPLPAKSRACTDTPNNSDPESMKGMMVCDMMLTSDGQAALAGFIKNFKTAPFKIIAHATVRADPGTPVPAGTIDFFVRPTVRFTILK